MKTMKGILLMTAVMAFVAIGCGNRDSEKKIAQLESRLAELEGKKPAAGIATSAITAVIKRIPFIVFIVSRIMLFCLLNL